MISSSSKQIDDDTAYIFNRNSLLDCINAKSGLRNFSCSSTHLVAADEKSRKELFLSHNYEQRRLSSQNGPARVYLPVEMMPQHKQKQLPVAQAFRMKINGDPNVNPSRINGANKMTTNTNTNNNKQLMRPTSLDLNGYKKESSI